MIDWGKYSLEKHHPCWRAARILGQIYLRPKWNKRDARLVSYFVDDPSVTNRLIDQGIAYHLGRRHKRHGAP